MPEAPRLLVVWHSASGGTRDLVEAAVEGATDPMIAEALGSAVDVRVMGALEAGVEDVMAADGYLLATPENFGYMSGALKDFFDRTYYPCLEHTRGRPYGLLVKAGGDGLGAGQFGGSVSQRNLCLRIGGIGGRVVADRGKVDKIAVSVKDANRRVEGRRRINVICLGFGSACGRRRIIHGALDARSQV